MQAQFRLLLYVETHAPFQCMPRAKFSTVLSLPQATDFPDHVGSGVNVRILSHFDRIEVLLL